MFVWCHPVLWNIIVCRPDRVCVYNRELAAATGCCVAKLFILIWAISHTYTQERLTTQIFEVIRNAYMAGERER